MPVAKLASRLQRSESAIRRLRSSSVWGPIKVVLARCGVNILARQGTCLCTK